MISNRCRGFRGIAALNASHGRRSDDGCAYDDGINIGDKTESCYRSLSFILRLCGTKSLILYTSPAPAVKWTTKESIFPKMAHRENLSDSRRITNTGQGRSGQFNETIWCPLAARANLHHAMHQVGYVVVFGFTCLGIRLFDQHISRIPGEDLISLLRRKQYGDQMRRVVRAWVSVIPGDAHVWTVCVERSWWCTSSQPLDGLRGVSIVVSGCYYCMQQSSRLGKSEYNGQYVVIRKQYLVSEHLQIIL